MDRMMRFAHVVSREAAWASGWLLMLAAIVVSVDVIIRKLFAVSLGGADEIAGYALAIGGAWALSYALLERVHIRIDSLYAFLPPRLRAFLDVAGVLSLGVFVALIAWHGFLVLDRSLQAGARSMSALETPAAVPQALWVGGLALFVAVAALLLARSVTALVRGDLPRVTRLIGSRTAIEETQEEVRAVTEARGRAGDRG